MQLNHFLYLVLGASFFAACSTNTLIDNFQGEKTIFQTSSHWKPVTDVRADVAIVYGTHDRPDMTFEQRIQSWRGREFYKEVFARQLFNYKNLFDSRVGFMRGKDEQGKWTPNFDPYEWGGPFTEGRSMK